MASLHGFTQLGVELMQGEFSFLEGGGVGGGNLISPSLCCEHNPHHFVSQQFFLSRHHIIKMHVSSQFIILSVRSSHLAGNPRLRVVSPESIPLGIRADTVRG